MGSYFILLSLKALYPVVCGFILLFIGAGCKQKPTVTPIESNNLINPAVVISNHLKEFQSYHLYKYSNVNGRVDSVMIKHPDWEKEIDIIDNLNIDKPVYKGIIQIDSSYVADTLIYKITCLEEKLKLKEVKLSYFHKQLLHINAIIAENNFIYSDSKQVYFNPKKGYKISGNLHTVLFFKYELSYDIVGEKTI